jgi:hypothetical protein
MRITSSVPSRFCEIERADRVVIDHTPGVADHVRVALLEPEQTVGTEPGIHAGQHGDLLAGRKRQRALVESLRIALRVLDQRVGDGHRSSCRRKRFLSDSVYLLDCTPHAPA